MTDKKILQTFLAATALTLIACALYIGLAGTSDDNIRLLLRLSGRCAFLLLLVIFVARPLRQLFQTPVTQSLLRNRPMLGVTFAGIHTAHLLVLIYRARQVPDFELSVAANLLGALTYAVIFAMLITTFSGPRRALGPKAWKVLHRFGLYWLTGFFTQTQLPRSLDDLSEMNWWLSSLIALALLTRLTAFFARRRSSG